MSAEPMFATYLSPQRSWYRSDSFPAEKITDIYISAAPTEADEQWHADALESGSVVCYRRGSVLNLVGSQICLPPDCRGLFAGMDALTHIHGLEKLDASRVRDLRSAFSGNQMLQQVDLSGWDLSHVRNTDQMFSDCHSLQHIHLGSGLSTVGNRMFFRCLSLESVSGLGQVTKIGDRAFIYTPALCRTDLNAGQLIHVGEAACRLSAIEDSTDFSALPQEAVQMRATRAVRWSAMQLQRLRQTRPDKPSFISIPNADCQKNYTGTYGHEASGETYTIAKGACRSFAIYHICNAYLAQAGKPVYKSWEDWWNNAVEDRYSGPGTFAYNDNDMDSMRVLQFLLAASGLSIRRGIVVDADSKATLIGCLAAGNPLYCSVPSANTNRYHAVVLHGYDPVADKFALCDSAVCPPKAVTSWLKFEDIFSDPQQQNGSGGRYQCLQLQRCSPKRLRRLLSKIKGILRRLLRTFKK